MDRRLYRLRVAQVVRETEQARSFVLDIPPALAKRYDYMPGQFLTVRTEIAGREHYRSYSMSSAPALGEPLQVTVKRVPGGAVSNWLIDGTEAGAALCTTVPRGRFVLGAAERNVVAFAGGSGITPLFSMVKTALATTSRAVRLMCANRDRSSAIFAAQLETLAARYPGRLDVVHHLDAERGLVGEADLHGFLEGAGAGDGEFYLCGPEPFMTLVERVLRGRGVPADRVHLERFAVAETLPAAGDEPTGTADSQVTVHLGRGRGSGLHRAGHTLLQTMRALGMKPPSSCEAGSCGTCIGQVVEGAAVMRNNGVLTADEVAEGWVLACQAEPVTPAVKIVFD